MSIFQCQRCGCAENTALSGQGCDGFAVGYFDWTGIEDRKGKKLCSACAPTKFKGGQPTEYGRWHGRFARMFLPMGQFRTAQNGNLEHIESGDQNYHKYEIASPATDSAKEQHRCRWFNGKCIDCGRSYGAPRSPAVGERPNQAPATDGGQR